MEIKICYVDSWAQQMSLEPQNFYVAWMRSAQSMGNSPSINPKTRRIARDLINSSRRGTFNMHTEWAEID